MSKSLDIDNYPKQYLELFLQAIERDELVIPCKDEKQAKRIQFDLYGFRNAVSLQNAELGRSFKAFRLIVEFNTRTLGYDIIFQSKSPDSAVLDAVLNPRSSELPEEIPETNPKVITGNEDALLQDPVYRAMKGLPPLAEPVPVPAKFPGLEKEGNAGEQKLADLGYGTKYNQGEGVQTSSEEGMRFVVGLQEDSKDGEEKD